VSRVINHGDERPPAGNADSVPGEGGSTPDRVERPARGRPVTVRPPRAGSRPARRPSVRQRLRYRFDNSLAHGPLALIGWLGVVVVALILVAAVVGHFLLEGARTASFVEDFWQSVIRVLDSSAFQSESAWPSRLVALVVTLLGVFLGGSLIGLIAAALDQRVAALSTGRSAVVETGHTLVLGWSARLPVIVEELVVANESLARPAIVILAPRPITDMEAELRDRISDTRNTRVVCRSGNPAKPADLHLANIAGARSVIVLAGDEGDAAVVKTILAVKVVDPDFSRANVVAEFATPANAETIRSLTDGAVSTVNSDEVIAQVTAQACHQSGLSAVFRELMDFGGDECYFVEVPELVGHTYAEALLAFPAASVIGWYTAAGVVELNPPPGTVFGPGDQVIAIAEDDDTIAFGGFRHVDPATPAAPPGETGDPIRVLLVGWSNFGPKVVEELTEFLAPGSRIEVCVEASLVGAEEIREGRPELEVSFINGGPEKLMALGEGAHFDQVIVLGYCVGLTTSEADARTLLTLLTLRKIWPADHTPRVRIIAQLLDQSNAELAAVTGIDDFIVSDALASLMLAQLSERAELQAVFDDLFDPDGAVVELRPAHLLVPDASVTYARAVAAGAAIGVSVIGWRVNQTGEVVVNPAKDRPVHLGPDDQILLVGLRAH
jgi:ion channel POLLUX/CASTOR